MTIEYKQKDIKKKPKYELKLVADPNQEKQLIMFQSKISQ